MPKSIRYFWPLYQFENLSQSIISDLPFPKMLKYYLTPIFTTFEKITPELENMIDLVLYALLFPFFKSDIKNNKGIFSSDDLLSLLGEDKKKKPIQL